MGLTVPLMLEFKASRTKLSAKCWTVGAYTVFGDGGFIYIGSGTRAKSTITSLFTAKQDTAGLTEYLSKT